MLGLQQQPDPKPWRELWFYLRDSHTMEIQQWCQWWLYKDAGRGSIKVRVWWRVVILQRLSDSEQNHKSPPGMPFSGDLAWCGDLIWKTRSAERLRSWRLSQLLIDSFQLLMEVRYWSRVAERFAAGLGHSCPVFLTGERKRAEMPVTASQLTLFLNKTLTFYYKNSQVC